MKFGTTYQQSALGKFQIYEFTYPKKYLQSTYWVLSTKLGAKEKRPWSKQAKSLFFSHSAGVIKQKRNKNSIYWTSQRSGRKAVCAKQWPPRHVRGTDCVPRRGEKGKMGHKRAGAWSPRAFTPVCRTYIILSTPKGHGGIKKDNSSHLSGINILTDRGW